MLSLLFQFCSNSELNEVNVQQGPILKSYSLKKEELSANQDDFQLFWNNFRRSISDSDYISLQIMVSDPLTVKGHEDQDPVLKIESKLFVSFFKYFLGEFEGERAKFYTQLKNLVDCDTYQARHNIRQIEDLEFSKTENGWKLSLIYMDTRGLKDKYPIIKQ